MLTAQWLYGMSGCLIAALGLRTALLHACLLHRVIAINVTGAGVFMVLIAVAYRGAGHAAGPRPPRPGTDRDRRGGERYRPGPGAGEATDCGANQ